MKIFIIKPSDQLQKIGNFIRKNSSLSYPQIQKLFRLKKIRLNGSNKIKIDSTIKESDEIRIYYNIDDKISKVDIKPGNVKVILDNKIYDNSNYLIINKPSGLAVQGGKGIINSIADMLVSCKDTQEYKLVHRLDKDTSGILIIAKNNLASAKAAEKFKKGEVEKVYWAVVDGKPRQKSGTISAFLRDDDTKQAMTQYKILKSSNEKTLLELKPITGKKHQLRIHLAKILGVPIIGDKKYNFASKAKEKLLLHAKAVNFKDVDGKNIEVMAELPEYFIQSIENYFGS